MFQAFSPVMTRCMGGGRDSMPASDIATRGAGDTARRLPDLRDVYPRSRIPGQPQAGAGPAGVWLCGEGRVKYGLGLFGPILRERVIATPSNGHFPGDLAQAPPSALDERKRASGIPGDAELVARVRNGEVEAYRPLVERYQRAALGLATRLLGKG